MKREIANLLGLKYSFAISTASSGHLSTLRSGFSVFSARHYTKTLPFHQLAISGLALILSEL
jgi:hypothetical protein